MKSLDNLEKHLVSSQLAKKIQQNRFYMFVLTKENAIFDTKRIVQELTLKHALLTREEVNPIGFQITHGVYCSVDYEASLTEIGIL